MNLAEEPEDAPVEVEAEEAPEMQEEAVMAEGFEGADEMSDEEDFDGGDWSIEDETEEDEEPANTFAAMGLDDRVLRSLDKASIYHPTPIQAEAIPAALEGRDVLGLAQTGTGKTLAFMIPIAEKLGKGRTALILTPTRELAAQIAETAQMLKLKHAVIIGGAPMRPQLTALASRPSIIVATPGRLEDHMARGTAPLHLVDIAVLDEADRMLDMGFAPAIRRIMDAVPEARQTMLFSATMPDEISSLADDYMNEPARFDIGETGKPVDLIHQEVVYTRADDKHDHLLRLLDENPDGPVLVFTRTRHGARKLAAMLRSCDHSAAEIHSDRTLAQRKAALKSFKDGRNRVLAATDIAARGIDVNMISLVVNFDLPLTSEDYVHRIGRTGRAGATGKAVSLVGLEQAKAIWAIERATGRDIVVSEMGLEPPDRPVRGAGKGKRYDARQQDGGGSRGPRREFNNDRPRRSYDGDRPRRDFGGERKPWSNDRPQRSYDGDRPQRSFDGERKPWSNDRPQRSFDGDRPQRSFDGERKPWSNDRPQRSFDGERKPYNRDRQDGDRPQRSFDGERKPWNRDRQDGDRPQRSFDGERKPWNRDRQDGDRPQRSFDGERKPWNRDRQDGDRPQRSFDGERKPWSNDRPQRSFDGERKPWNRDRQDGDRPQRSFDGERKPWNRDRQDGDRPQRSFDGERKPWNRDRQDGDRPQRSFDGERKPWNRDRQDGDRPQRSFDGDRKPYNSDRPQRSFDGERKPFNRESKPTDAPYRRFDPDAPLPWEKKSEGGESGLRPDGFKKMKGGFKPGKRPGGKPFGKSGFSKPKRRD